VLFGMIEIINAATRDKVIDTSAFGWKKWHVYTLPTPGDLQENATGGNNPLPITDSASWRIRRSLVEETYPIPAILRRMDMRQHRRDIWK